MLGAFVQQDHRLPDRKARALVVAVVLAAVGCGSDGTALRFEHAARAGSSPSPREPDPDRVAACDQARDGLRCGDPSRETHCIYGVCAVNVCGDRAAAYGEGCDDGNEDDGDGCSSRCGIEECGNGTVDFGERCDDGNDDDQDGCGNDCRPTSGGADGGADAQSPDASRLDCAVEGELSAEPMEAQIGERIELGGIEIEGAQYFWSGMGGTLAGESGLRARFICRTEGEHELRFSVNRPGCTLLAKSIFVTCTAPPSMDAGGLDGGIDAGMADAAVDSATPDGGSGSDAAVSTVVPGVTLECEACVLATCTQYEGSDLASPCFLEGRVGIDQGALEQPGFTEDCRDAVACSVLAASGCASNPTGPFQCYCGAQELDPCAMNGPLSSAECVEEWEAATRCSPGDFTCVSANFSELGRPAGYARYTIECISRFCADQCL